MKINKLFKKILLAAGASMIWEVAATWWEKSKSARGMDYWRVYFDQPTVNFAVKNRQIHTVFSTGVKIHLDVYPVDDPNAPVIIFNHGAAGYCRLFVALAQCFNQCGYTVVLPDQRGQGLSDGRRGDYTIAECTHNIVDVANWAKIRFGSTVFLAGGSVGGL